MYSEPIPRRSFHGQPHGFFGASGCQVAKHVSEQATYLTSQPLGRDLLCIPTEAFAIRRPWRRLLNGSGVCRVWQQSSVFESRGSMCRMLKGLGFADVVRRRRPHGFPRVAHPAEGPVQTSAIATLPLPSGESFGRTLRRVILGWSQQELVATNLMWLSLVGARETVAAEKACRRIRDGSTSRTPGKWCLRTVSDCISPPQKPRRISARASE